MLRESFHRFKLNRMKARLSIIEGKDAGGVFALDKAETLIGREDSNQIWLDDASVSRRHCFVERRGENFFISDLESLNGTFVNDLPAENKQLKHQDKIKIGKYVLLFLNENETPGRNEKDLELPPDALRLGLDEAIGAMARDLTALLQISHKINSVRGLENLQIQLLELLFEVVPAEKSVILLTENDQSEEISSVFGLHRDQSPEIVNFSKTVAQQVFRAQTAILANDIPGDFQLSSSESLILFQTTSLLCVPLVLYGKTTGAIYLETNKQTAQFDENHLRFVSAVGGIAAVAIENARQFDRLEAENRFLREQNLENHNNMIGESAAMEKAFKFIAKAAPTDSTVLITGESGTGKELAARAIHENSRRRDKPFVAINCAALTDNLLESELFGHEKGAFTGAVNQKKGKIEIAEGGTLFLDEIGEMAINLQAKLLRVLQEREFDRVGGTKPIKADIRLVAATNRDLEAEVKAGNFRQDLFYRLNVVRFTMPALRERPEDILLLAENFAERFSRQLNRRMRGISSKAKKLLLAYDFPGNVRELENAIERAIVLGSSEWILPEDLPENILENSNVLTDEAANGAAAQTYHDVVLETKKQLIRNALKEAKGSYVEAAKRLDVHPNYLHRLIRNFNLKTELENF